MYAAPLVFVERDYLLRHVPGELPKPPVPGQIEIDPAVARQIAELRRDGLRLVTIANDPRVGRGEIDVETVSDLYQQIIEQLEQVHSLAVFDRHEFCPIAGEQEKAVVSRSPSDHAESAPARTSHLPGQHRLDVNRMLPGPGMLVDAAEALGARLADCFVVGGKFAAQAGRTAGCKTVCITGSESASAGADKPPHFHAATIVSALRTVMASLRGQPARPDGKPTRPDGKPLAQPKPTPQVARIEDVDRLDDARAQLASHRSEPRPSLKPRPRQKPPRPAESGHPVLSEAERQILARPAEQSPPAQDKRPRIATVPLEALPNERVTLRRSPSRPGRSLLGRLINGA